MKEVELNQIPEPVPLTLSYWSLYLPAEKRLWDPSYQYKLNGRQCWEENNKALIRRLILTIAKSMINQSAKKVLSEEAGTSGISSRLVDSVCYLPNGQVKFPGKCFEKIQIKDCSNVRDKVFECWWDNLVFFCTVIEIT